MKTRNRNPREAVEETLLLLMGDRTQVTISRLVLAEEAQVGPNSVTRANTWLIASGRWEIDLGYGRNETVYRYIGK